MNNEFDTVILQISDKLQRTLSFLPENIKQSTEEIRLRAGLPVCLTVSGRVMFVLKNSSVSEKNSDECLIASHDDLQQTLLLLCNNSVYLHESEIKQGYISLLHGNRAGVCGVFNADGIITSISSVNIRIARQIFGCAEPLLNYTDGGLLICGPPASGKTTILRDLIRLLSNGKNGRYKRVAVIDGRGEISGGFGDNSFNDLGINTDVLYMQNKALGTEIALRTMFPDVIAFDEIGTPQELKGVMACFNAGVDIITTAHCKNKRDIMRRSVTANMVKSGAVSRVALLSEHIGTPPMIFDIKELMINVIA